MRSVKVIEEPAACPLCGRYVTVSAVPSIDYPYSSSDRFSVQCFYCGLLFGYDPHYGGEFESKDAAIEEWNEACRQHKKRDA